MTEDATQTMFEKWWVDRAKGDRVLAATWLVLALRHRTHPPLTRVQAARRVLLVGELTRSEYHATLLRLRKVPQPRRPL